ncbi:unnamed protein product [Parajaminaea phylloscopi]
MSDSGGSDSSSSGPVASPSSPSSSTSPLHAQAVRFLTSLRHHSPDSSAEAQRDFLKSKGLDEAAIEAAFHDSKRPQSAESPTITLPLQTSPASTELTEEAAFDLAKQAFDDPIHSPAPPALPAKSYPKSPLALYYQGGEGGGGSGSEAGGVANGSARELALTRRYAVLLAFFRSLTYFATLGGALTSIAVLLYRAYALPKWTTTLNCRSYLLKHHHSLWDNLVGTVRALKGTRLAPADKLVRVVPPSETADEDGEDASGEKDIAAGRKNGSKRVQFADEVDGGGQLEQREGEEDAQQLKKTSHMDKSGAESPERSNEASQKDGEQDALLTKEAGKDEATGDAAHQENTKIRYEPVDLCEPIRSSLAMLNALLRDQPVVAAPSSSASSPWHPSPRAASVEDEGDDDDAGESSSSDSWQDDDVEGEDADDVEFDPFVEVHGKPKKASRPSKSRSGTKRLGSGNSKKHSPSLPSSSSSSSSFAPPITASAFAATHPPSASTALYDSLADMNAAINARSLAAQTSQAFRMGGLGSSAAAGLYGNFSFGNAGKSGTATTTATTTAAAAAPEEDRAKEIAAQIKAEIRSFKGLLVSRRNFPRYGPGLVGGSSHTNSAAATTAA